VWFPKHSQTISPTYTSENMQLLKSEVALTDEDGLKRYKRIDAQLRRLCERKPSGKLNVPLSVHQMWSKGGTDRDELRLMFEQYELNKDHNCIHAWCFFQHADFVFDTLRW
jgi:hypothetical protein